ncbi:SDR family NAD(P)-dependent oxidoreductase [Rhodococcus sp. NPDC127530]|uniref:SDR family NAD(P)-dependent oxidoreductase n=1 Tax=unclassified Rhodococcus (in: high G+C Gram-positive bacteria) TaxID=192944 RepID=UPI0036280BE4
MTTTESTPQTGPLAGRVALITGASGGIGGAIARRLAADGADLFLAHGRHVDDAAQVADHARSLGRRVALAPGDLADPAVPAALVDQATEQLGSVDIVIANAGVGAQTPWDQVDLDQWNTTLAVNLTAPFLLAQRALPTMIDRGFGRVLFISSIAALNGGVVGPHYAASKAGLHGLTHFLAPRVAGSGVTVNALAPALIGNTRILPTDPEGKGKLPMPIPVGRLGEPDEVADMAITMLRNSYLTNKVITLDGGLLPR